jgi:hypothetical protein
VEVELSAHGANDFVLEFLVGSGLWGILTGMTPDRLKKENGKPWRALNGVEVLRELARVERISQCGKILRDARLMMVAGFNAEAVQKAHEAGRPVVDPETLSNHLGRIRPKAAAKAFGEHVGLMRRKRWIRGGTYAADAHEIIVPYGRSSERLDVYDRRQQVVGQLNGVVAEEYDCSRRERMRDEKGQVRPRFHYVTTLPTAAKPPRIRGYYGQRWGIENQGFRELTQQWALDCLAGRRFNTLNSRIAFALMLYNAERLLRMKHPGPWQEERERLRGLGERNRLSGPSLVAYTPQGQLSFLRPREHERLIVERERDRLVHTLREGLAHGETLERMLQRPQNSSAS